MHNKVNFHFGRKYKKTQHFHPSHSLYFPTVIEGWWKNWKITYGQLYEVHTNYNKSILNPWLTWGQPSNVDFHYSPILDVQSKLLLEKVYTTYYAIQGHLRLRIESESIPKINFLRKHYSFNINWLSFLSKIYQI